MTIPVDRVVEEHISGIYQYDGLHEIIQDVSSLLGSCFCSHHLNHPTRWLNHFSLGDLYPLSLKKYGLLYLLLV